MSWKNQLKGDSVSWLLEADSPGVRYLALRDLADAVDEEEIAAARKAAHESGPIATILENMSKEGYWEKEGPGYNPKYRSTVWSLILLAQLGASATERRAHRPGMLLIFLDHALTTAGRFTHPARPPGRPTVCRATCAGR